MSSIHSHGRSLPLSLTPPPRRTVTQCRRVCQRAQCQQQHPPLQRRPRVPRPPYAPPPAGLESAMSTTRKEGRIRRKAGDTSAYKRYPQTAQTTHPRRRRARSSAATERITGLACDPTTARPPLSQQVRPRLLLLVRLLWRGAGRAAGRAAVHGV
eukprot:XP_001695888.1 predicted protein [Chlamydomonas reinhardtii]